MRYKLKTDFEMPKLHIRMTVEKDGQIISDRYEEGHSWTTNAYHFYQSFMLDALVDSNLYARDTSGVIYVANQFARWGTAAAYGFYNNANNLSFGIVIGTGTAAFHLEDYKLETDIQHGNTTDCLYYQAQIAPVVTYSGDPDYTQNILHKRVFNNNSGASITVNEVGITYREFGNHYILLSRDVLGVPTEVVNGAQLTTTISITTPSLEAIHSEHNIALGALGSGGIYMGWYDYTIENQSPGSHRKYGLILAPVSSESAGVVWCNPTQTVVQKHYYGQPVTALLEALGAISPLGQYVTAQNAAVLGGFSDWYVPGIYEFGRYYTIRASIPGGEGSTNDSYWSSTSNGPFAYTYNPVTNSVYSGTTQTASAKIRLFRRFLLSTWTPA